MESERSEECCHGTDRSMMRMTSSIFPALQKISHPDTSQALLPNDEAVNHEMITNLRYSPTPLSLASY